MQPDLRDATSEQREMWEVLRLEKEVREAKAGSHGKVGEGGQGAGSMLRLLAFRRGKSGRGLQVEYRLQGNNTKGLWQEPHQVIMRLGAERSGRIQSDLEVAISSEQWP